MKGRATFRFYRLKTEGKLFAFEDPIGEVPVFDQTLAALQENIVRKNGHELQDVQEEAEITDRQYFLFREDVFFTEAFLQAAVKVCLQQNSSRRFSLQPNSFNERFSLPDSSAETEYLKFPFHFRNKDRDTTEETILPQKVYNYSLKLPTPIVKDGNYAYDQCAVYATRIASPFHLLQANLAVNLNRTIKLQQHFPKWLIDKIAPVDSANYFRSLRSLNRIGKRCKIHRSAIIEGSIIGDDVTIGANAIVRLSKIGDGTHINDNVSVMHSVIGRHNTISNGNHINLCMTYDDVFLIHGPYQFSIFGKSSAVFAVINCDIRLDQKNIVIPTDSGMVDSKQPLLGIAYGHHSKVGGGNIIAAGRIVPNGRHILPPSSIITKFD